MLNGFGKQIVAKNTTCYVLLLKGGVTSWSSKNLLTLAFTSTKAKYNITTEFAKKFLKNKKKFWIYEMILYVSPSRNEQLKLGIND
jgi:hypothetical protein